MYFDFMQKYTKNQEDEEKEIDHITTTVSFRVLSLVDANIHSKIKEM